MIRAPGAKLHVVGGGNYADEIGDPVSSESNACFFEEGENVSEMIREGESRICEGVNPGRRRT